MYLYKSNPELLKASERSERACSVLMLITSYHAISNFTVWRTKDGTMKDGLKAVGWVLVSMA